MTAANQVDSELYPGSLTDVPGFRVGHADNAEALTGCTVVLAPEGTVGGMDQRGGAISSRQTDPLRLLHLVERVDAVLLAGGSAFGLGASSGVAKFLEERQVGFDVGMARVPIVPTAILFDLALGDASVRPDEAMAYAACEAASDRAVAQGNRGAGMGASLGKLAGLELGMKSGIGSASLQLGDHVTVGALMAVNPLGDVLHPRSAEILAGARHPDNGFANGEQLLWSRVDQPPLTFGSGENTVIGVVATNARLGKRGCTYVAQMAQDGIARSVRPAHTTVDGDTIFVLSHGTQPADPNIIGAAAAEVVALAIANAVMAAESAGGLPAWRDLSPGGDLAGDSD